MTQDPHHFHHEWKGEQKDCLHCKEGIDCKHAFKSDIPAPQPSWEENFDNKFWYVNNSLLHEHHAEGRCKCHQNIPNYLKSFIRSEIEKAREEAYQQASESAGIYFLYTEMPKAIRTALEDLRAEVEKIDVSGGGSGRRLKIQLLSFLDSKLKEPKT
jgi:hypothetical protein